MVYHTNTSFTVINGVLIPVHQHAIARSSASGPFSSTRAIACSLPFSNFPTAPNLVRRLNSTNVFVTLGQKRGTLLATVFWADDGAQPPHPHKGYTAFLCPGYYQQPLTPLVLSGLFHDWIGVFLIAARVCSARTVNWLCWRPKRSKIPSLAEIERASLQAKNHTTSSKRRSVR